MILQVTRLLRPGRGARGSGQRQDRAGAAEGQGPEPWVRRAASRAGGAAVLLDRARGVPQARGGVLAAQAPAGVRRHLRGARRAVGARDGRPDDSEFWEEPLPGSWPRRPPSCRPASVRLGRRRRGPGLRRRLVGVGASARCATRRRAACSCSRTRTSGSSPASAVRRCSWSRSSWTTTCGTPGRSTTASGRWRRAGCRRAAATGRRAVRPASTDKALDVADDEVEACSRRAGTRPRCLLTTGHRHPVQTEQVEGTARSATGAPSGRARTSSTATCSARRVWSGRASCCASTRRASGTGRASGCTSGCRARPTCSWSSGTRT